MILGQVSNLDCVVFLIFLIPQLLLNVNTFELIYHGLKILPFLFLRLPTGFISERYLTSRLAQSVFVQQASPFQDVVIRCVRYAFANLPANIGRVFFSKEVALPFLKFRMLRHGYTKSPIAWREVHETDVDGLWIIHNESQEPDIVIYYLHGGGFSMGSAYFYLEFLIGYLTLLSSHYCNPAIFALEYTLVPDASYPIQLNQTISGYTYALSLISNDSSRICVAGDSAGATLVLSLLLHIAQSPRYEKLRPGFATLISPWVTLVTEQNRDTRSDYLNASSLYLYGSQYAGTELNRSLPLVSPGACVDLKWWARAAPVKGLLITFGSEEVLGPEIRKLVKRLREAGVGVGVKEEAGGIHAWAVARLFLEGSLERRVKGLRELVGAVKGNIISNRS